MGKRKQLHVLSSLSLWSEYGEMFQLRIQSYDQVTNSPIHQLTSDPFTPLTEQTMSDRIQRIDEEIRKLEDRLRAMDSEVPGSPEDQKVHALTRSLLHDVIRDLRTEQEKLRAEEKLG